MRSLLAVQAVIEVLRFAPTRRPPCPAGLLADRASTGTEMRGCCYGWPGAQARARRFRARGRHAPDRLTYRLTEWRRPRPPRPAAHGGPRSASATTARRRSLARVRTARAR